MVKLAGAGRVVGVYIGFDLFHMLILSIATNERYSRKNVTFSLPKIFVIGLLIRLNEGGNNFTNNLWYLRYYFSKF